MTLSAGREKEVSDMLDREAIREIVLRYYDAIWRGDIDAVVELFAADGTIRVNGPLAGVPPVGHEELHRFYVAGVKRMVPRPFGHNHLINLHENGKATGRCYVELRSSVDYSWIGAVIYEDDYIKAGGEWKIQARKATLQNYDLEAV